MATPALTPLLLLPLLFIFSFPPLSSSSSYFRRDPLAYAGRRTVDRGGDKGAAVNCEGMPSREQCLGRAVKSRCRWCRSDALDDMCFGLAEAWRLPPQVFSCQ